MKRFSLRLIIVLAVLIAAVVYSLPTLKPGLWPDKRINLGLDLQGGMHLVLEVNTVKAVESTIERNVSEIRDLARRNQIQNLVLERPAPAKIAVEVTGAENVAKFKQLLDKELRDLRSRTQSEEADRLSLVLDLADADAEQIKKLANKPLPLTQVERGIFAHVVELWEEALAGYQRCLKDA
ncbi:MAG: hypothetical protein EHM15_02255, partial [Desulfobacteraceae bacterium]